MVERDGWHIVIDDAAEKLTIKCAEWSSQEVEIPIADVETFISDIRRALFLAGKGDDRDEP